MRRQKILCAALAVTFALGSCQTGQVKAASQDPAQKKEVQTESVQTDGEQTESAQTEQPEEPEKTAEERLAEYYDNSVFIGDSIMLGFRNYSSKATTFVHDIDFLAAGSYSALNAMKPVAGKNVHPMYKGKKYQVWDAVPLVGSERVFILLGMNDISPLGLEGARDTYQEVINKIVEKSPDIEINIISVTYTLKGEGKGKLNNTNIDKYNVLLKGMAEENGWGYIDLCTSISDGAGNLGEKYCSDGFVHLSKSAYAVWEKELTRYAEKQFAKEDAEKAKELEEAEKEKASEEAPVSEKTTKNK